MIESAKTYSPGECAVTCGVPTRTILTAIRKGELPAVRFNARVLRIARSDLLAWRIRCTEQIPPACTSRTSPTSPAPPPRPIITAHPTRTLHA